ncbi:MAG: ribosomal protein S18-alanine N-acetyltransferase [Methylococcales bacterium]
MMEFLDRVKELVVYDADRDFYAKVFPGSVSRQDLMRLRKMRPSDLPAVLAIENANYQFPWNEAIFQDCLRVNYSCWVCVESDKILGFSIVSIAVGEAHILNINVHPDEQKQGVGRKMLVNMIDVARSKNAETIFLEVRPTNLGAIALYDSMGFNEIGVRKGYYPAENGREDALMLALELV